MYRGLHGNRVRVKVKVRIGLGGDGIHILFDIAREIILRYPQQRVIILTGI